MSEDIIVATKMFLSLSPECQELILNVMRSMVRSNEENQERAEDITNGATE